ncbi:FAD-NAD(P)-binding [Duganella sp. CF517]|uniref:FAD/NAD(P)-binding protein n=1 Tax=Duganella sp. CF517 TaxID=1881038 RepID=UPI0008B5E406|nr:FAD/NAD(P)-binding domain-containing protein [Duganella sp. CF517]SEO47714.1 FAD-NAD(P)-binding [Duganella sp. CF517]
MKRYSVTIVGMGPRGLSVLERIAAIAGSRQLLLDIILIEPGECGPGVHTTRQPRHLLINTVASQVTMFPAPGAVHHAPPCATPTLTAWARQSGYRRFGDSYHRIAGAGADITESDYLPRSMLGEYLAWACQQVAAALPAGVTLTHHRLRANDLWQQQDGRTAIELESGFIVHSDFVFLTTGHGRNRPSDQEAALAKFAQDHARYNSRLSFVRHIYPLDKLERLAPEARVAIQGLGLSAHDVIAELTVGRGGAFVRQPNGEPNGEPNGQGVLRYQRSGREPKLTLCSRNCLPYAARGINQKGLDGRHHPHYFTPDAVEALRRKALATRGSRQLDFDRELLPLLKREMAWVYRHTLARTAALPANARADGAALVPDPLTFVPNADDEAAIDALLFPLRERQFDNLDDFRAFFTDWLQDDLQEARLGNIDSPTKAATDVLRDVRATLQAAIEHGGLTPASHRKFLNVYHPAINRAAFGPPLRRNEELLALLDAGVIDIVSGPNSVVETDEDDSTYVLSTKFAAATERRPIDALVVARLDAFFPETDESLLIRNVLKRGLVRPYYNGVFHPGGIDIDEAGQPLNIDGEPARNIWALGYPVEGCHYYTHALPRPMLRSRQVLDADRCVTAMFAQMADSPRRHPGHRSPVPAPALAPVPVNDTQHVIL